MKPVRTGLATAAVAVLMIAPATAAHAAATTVVVTPDDLNGWVVTPFPTPTSVPFAFEEGPSTVGSGSLRFGPIGATPPQNKMIVNRDQTIPAADLDSIAYDFHIDPAATNKAPAQFYLNVYVQTPATGARFFDCRYDYVPTTGVDGWNTFTATATATATEAANGATCGSSVDDVAADGTIFRITLNGGDTSANGAGIQGGFDNVGIAVAGDTVTYDFEPLPVTACDTAPSPGRVGTARNDLVRGTADADRIDVLGGNDVVDAAAGDDCLLGGAGNDVLRAGDGDDEIIGGEGNDTIDPAPAATWSGPDPVTTSSP